MHGPSLCGRLRLSYGKKVVRSHSRYERIVCLTCINHLRCVENEDARMLHVEVSCQEHQVRSELYTKLIDNMPVT
jgi:hypothetical protein